MYRSNYIMMKYHFISMCISDPGEKNIQFKTNNLVQFIKGE